jgi:hypothetical protein
MKITTAFVVGLMLAALSLSAEKTKPAPDPVAWGVLSGNAGCVIFAEGRKTSGRFYGIAVTTKTVGKLTVIETQNYTFNQKVVLETEDNMNNLMQIAEKDHIKFVKIPEKYSPDLLEEARASCKAGAQ